MGYVYLKDSLDENELLSLKGYIFEESRELLHLYEGLEKYIAIQEDYEY
ncbi:hypothetical protein [Psychrobacter sp. ANT_H56B]|nr:hypothetical protein [Psychrobacter sp. ANT_H56B]